MFVLHLVSVFYGKFRLLAGLYKKINHWGPDLLNLNLWKEYLKLLCFHEMIQVAIKIKQVWEIYTVIS